MVVLKESYLVHRQIETIVVCSGALRMSESVSIAINRSTRTNLGSFRRFGGAPSVTRGFLSSLLRLWPSKPDIELSARIGLSDRTCREILAGRAKLSLEALAALLRTDDGLSVLEALMGDARPKWWRKFRRSVELADLRLQQEDTRKRLEALERGEI